MNKEQANIKEIQIRQATIHPEEDRWIKLRKKITSGQQTDGWVAELAKKQRVKKDTDGLVRMLDDGAWKIQIPAVVAKQVTCEVHLLMMNG